MIENQVSNVVTTQIKKWEFAFPVLLYHWRCILRGYSPFKLARDNPDELRERGHIDEQGFQYVTKIANLFDRTNPGEWSNSFFAAVSNPRRPFPTATYRIRLNPLVHVE
jgi:hypothetical protein